ncbi:MAG: esterase/lipase family protein [Thermoanaerobaculia bacterium]
MPEAIQPPFYPIIYLRGYAMSMSEIEDTVADPYMGFNLGSTKIRQRWDGKISKYIFESPLVRLMKDHGYSDVYDNGDELAQAGRVSPKTIWIYRYYDDSSETFGEGKPLEIEKYAQGLAAQIERIRDLTCGAADSGGSGIKKARERFRVYLVAHSMGGLIARCYLQKVAAGQKTPVDKVFTYGTPHGGIDLRGLGNVPSFVTLNELDTFNETRMRKFLGIPQRKSVSSLNGAYDPSRFFCLVGTNYRDYNVAMGLAKRAVGPMSDGLVMIKNASVDDAPRAFVHRAHSGHYGIVNSEEGYQNLRRFLFGNLRVEATLKIDEISLPEELKKMKQKGKKIRASYHAEVVARVRGKRWDLHRRTTTEESAIFIPYEKVEEKSEIHLSSSFLMASERVDMRRQGLGFSIDLGVLVPEYEVDGALFLKHHFEGGYLYRDKVNLEVSWGDTGDQPRLRYGFDSETPNRMSGETEVKLLVEEGGAVGFEFVIPLEQATKPGLRAGLILRSYGWN